jgi:hypothetical protein
MADGSSWGEAEQRWINQLIDRIGLGIVADRLRFSQSAGVSKI